MCTQKPQNDLQTTNPRLGGGGGGMGGGGLGERSYFMFYCLTFLS